MTNQELIRQHFIDSITVKQNFLTVKNIRRIHVASTWMLKSLRSRKAILLCGNGGSAADAQHIAAEFVGRFKTERGPLPAIALGTNFSAITCIGNDYGFENIFSRPLEAFGKSGGVLIAISTSGNSKNVLNAVRKGKKMGMKTLSLTGEDGGALKKISDMTLRVPSSSTPSIQETHITIGHALCALVEERLKK